MYIGIVQFLLVLFIYLVLSIIAHYWYHNGIFLLVLFIYLVLSINAHYWYHNGIFLLVLFLYLMLSITAHYWYHNDIFLLVLFVVNHVTCQIPNLKKTLKIQSIYLCLKN